MHQRYVVDPESVSESWREFFSDYQAPAPSVVVGPAAPYVEVAGKPGVVRHEHVGLGLAVDVEKADGSRSLLVPCIKDADTLDFRMFHAAYEDVIRKVKSNKVGPDDFAGVTATLTNPG